MARIRNKEAMMMDTYDIYYKGTYIGYVSSDSEEDAFGKAVIKVIISNGQCDRKDVRVEKSFF